MSESVCEIWESIDVKCRSEVIYSLVQKSDMVEGKRAVAITSTVPKPTTTFETLYRCDKILENACYHLV